MKHIFILSLLSLLTVSCSKGDERLKEKARIEGDTLRDVENSNLAQKAESMEKDLARRHLFYQAIKGNYEGTISTNAGTFNIRITLTPSLPPIRVNRVRQLEEISSDLNNLMLNTQVVQWDPNSSISAVGCRVSNVRPDIEKGELAISHESCPNLYLIKIADRGGSTSSNTIASWVLSGDMSEVDSLSGQIQPSTNANIFNFTAFKVQE